MATPILAITDGTTRVSLLTSNSGINACNYEPGRPAFKDDGGWADSSLSDGRQLQMRKWTNIVDVFTLIISGDSQDAIIEDARNLTMLLEKAVSYWTTEWQNEPVWIERRGSKETNVSHALIHAYKWENDSNPFAPPFYAPSKPYAMDGVTLAVEHSPWMANPPGESECVQVSNLMKGGLALTEVAKPTGSGDNAFVYTADELERTWRSVVWSDDLGMFLVVGDRIMYSFDGISWVYVEKSTDSWPTDVMWLSDLGKFVAVGLSGNVYQSSDGINWTISSAKYHTADDPDFAEAMAYSPSLKRFVVVNGNKNQQVYTSNQDALTWTQRGRILSGTHWRDVVWAPSLNLFCAVGDNGAVATSPDGIAWTVRESPVDVNLQSIAWSENLSIFVVVPNGFSVANSVITSSNGVNWTARNSPDGYWLDVEWCDGIGIFVACARDTVKGVMTSTNGTSWTAHSTPTGAWATIAYSHALSTYVAFDALYYASPIFMTSSNSINWTAYKKDDFQHISIGDDALTVDDYGIKTIGIRFRNVEVPQGAVVESSKINLVNLNTEIISAGNPSAIIYGEDSVSPSAFSTYANFLGRTKTSQSVDFNIIEWGVGTKVSTPDVKNIIQHIIDSAGWNAGNDIVLFVEGDRSNTTYFSSSFASLDNPTYNEPELVIRYYTPDSPKYGRLPTCEDEVYLANKDNTGKIDKMFYYDHPNTTYTELPNLGAGFSELLPNPVDENDRVYFGSDEPFCSLVFDLHKSAGTAELTWEYSIGGGLWRPLTVHSDVSEYQNFSVASVGMVGWLQPQSGVGSYSDDWDKNNVNGTTMYWVRARVSFTGANPTTPIQKSRPIYTITRSSVDAEAIGGDIPAIVKIEIVNANASNKNVRKGIISTRSLNRGEDFVPHINACEQNDDRIVCSLGTETVSMVAPSGNVRRYALTENMPWTTTWGVKIGTPLNWQYYGRYRVFARAYCTTINEGDVSSRVTVEMGVKRTSNVSKNIGIRDGFWYFDYGIVSIPPCILPADYLGSIDIKVDLKNNTADTGNFDWIDLTLVPVDEFAAEFNQTPVSNAGDITILDSVSYVGKSNVFSALRKTDDFEIYDIPSVVSPSPIMLQAEEKQRFFVFIIEDCVYEWVGRIRIWHNARYLTFRGDK